MNAAFHQISKKTCELESESLMTTLQSLTAETTAFRRKERGLMAVRRGRVAYVFKCKTVEVTYRPTELDTEDIPVYTPGDEPMFVGSLNNIIKPNSTVVPSSSNLPVMYKIGGEWFCKNREK